MFFLIARGDRRPPSRCIIAFDDLRRERIFAYLDPWNPKYVQGKAYQLTHSLIAFGRGEIFGQGLGASVEKLHYLPEAHTDFLLAVIGEELGFVGVLAVIAGFFWLTRRIFVIGRQAIALDRVFAGLMVQGIGIWIGGQAFINMGVNLGVLPTKGLTLPLMSYRRLGDADEPGRAGAGGAGGHGEPSSSCAEAAHERRRQRPRARTGCTRRRSRNRRVMRAWGPSMSAPRRHGGRHRRPRDPRAGRRARDAAPRLERQLAGHDAAAWRTSSCRRRGIALDTHRLHRPARQGPAARR